MTDLTLEEQDHVRLALRYVRARWGSWASVAKALRLDDDTPSKIATGRRGVTANVAIRLARLANVSIDALLAGGYVPAGTCPSCGHPPVDARIPCAMARGGRP